MAVDAATLAGHLRNFLTQTGNPVRDFQFQYGIAPGTPSGQETGGQALPGQIYLNPKFQSVLDSIGARYGQRGRLTPQQLEVLRIMTHEGIHQMRYGRTPDVAANTTPTPGTQRGWEEGTAEAMTQDLLPILTARLFGHKMPGMNKPPQVGTAYPDLVKNIRQLSVFGSGAKKATDYNARVWRRSFLHGDAETRQRLANEATQARIAWGQTTGRDTPLGQAPKPVTPKPVTPNPNGGWKKLRPRPVPGKPGVVDYV